MNDNTLCRVTEMLLENYFNTIPDCSGAFLDILPSYVSIHMAPKIDTFKFRKDKVEIEFSDLRLYNPLFHIAFCALINAIKADEYSDNEVVVEFDGWSIETLKVVLDVVTAIEVKAKKKGKNGWEVLTKAISSGGGCSDDTIHFHLIDEHIDAIKQWEPESGIQELFYMIAVKSHERIMEDENADTV